MTSFKIAIPDATLDLLHTKLSTTVFPDELDDAGWQYGVPLADIRRLVALWKDGFNWREEEKKLNEELPQYTTDIDVEGHGTLNIHYVYKKSGIKEAIPLLFVHGWPGSFIEVRKILPLLTNPTSEGPVFDVVAFSLPGYGFSEAPKKKGFRLAQYAEVGHKLMISLGYNEYVTQGGDWGFLITREIAARYGENHSKAWHTNMQLVVPPSESEPQGDPPTPAELAGLERLKIFQTLGNGYFVEQSTQPQTLAYSLADSPVGLLAWIYEKLVAWTDKYPWTDEEVLTWISIYWFSRAGPGASIRIYYEVVRANEMDAKLPVSSIPMGFSYFAQEIRLPRSWTSRLGNLVFESEHENGRHFAAHERPDDLVDDLRLMFRKDGPAFGVVSGRNGYAA